MSLRQHSTQDTTIMIFGGLFGLTNALVIFIDFMNHVFKPYLEQIIILFLDNIVVISLREVDHTEHLEILLEILRKHKLYARFLMCNFKMKEIAFLGHVIRKAYLWILGRSQPLWTSCVQKT